MSKEFTRVRAHGAAGFDTAPQARVTVNIDANGFALVEDVRRLVEAAPVLLAACQAVLNEFPAYDGKRIESVKAICRAAIDVATVPADPEEFTAYRTFSALPSYIHPTGWTDAEEAKATHAGRALWSNADMPPPAIGSVIQITVNNGGAGKVTGYFCEGGWLGLLVDWRGGEPAHVFGAEVAPLPSLDDLNIDYEAYLAAQGLPHESADELLAGDIITPAQRQWLTGFFSLWEAASEREDFEHACAMRGDR